MAYKPRYFATRRGQAVDDTLEDTYAGLKAAQSSGHTGKFRALDEITGKLITSVGAIREALSELKKAEIVRRADSATIHIRLLWALNMAQWVAIYELLKGAKS